MLSGKQIVDAMAGVLRRFVGIGNIRIADNLTILQAVQELQDTYEATELAQKLQDFSALLGKGTVLTIRLGENELKYEMDVACAGKSVFTLGDNTFEGLLDQALTELKTQPKLQPKKAKKKAEPKEEKLLEETTEDSPKS